jgi:hypothetical protein
VRIFKNKAFTRFAKKAGMGDAVLCDAIQDAERGLIAADLGGGVIKQRIARPGQGKSLFAISSSASEVVRITVGMVFQAGILFDVSQPG